MSIMKLLPFLFLGLLLSPVVVVQAEGETQLVPKVALSCTPKKVLVDGKTHVFTLTKGEGIEFGCLMINTTKEKLSGTLLGKQTTSLNGESAASAAVVSIEGEESKEVTLSFPAVFVGGNYFYAFKLMGSDGQSLSQDVVLTGVLVNKEELRITAATLDKDQYTWTDSAKLTLTLTANGQEQSFITNEKPTLTVAMLTADQTPCAYLIDKRALTEVKADYVFTFSQAELCSNAIKVTVQKENGEVMDQKIIAVALPERTQNMSKAPGKMLLSLNQPMGILTWVSVLCLIFLAYILWRHHKQQ